MLFILVNYLIVFVFYASNAHDNKFYQINFRTSYLKDELTEGPLFTWPAMWCDVNSYLDVFPSGDAKKLMMTFPVCCKRPFVTGMWCFPWLGHLYTKNVIPSFPQKASPVITKVPVRTLAVLQLLCHYFCKVLLNCCIKWIIFHWKIQNFWFWYNNLTTFRNSSIRAKPSLKIKLNNYRQIGG